MIGEVIEITLRHKKIKTIRNELVAIPNQTLLQRQIINYSGLDYLGISVRINPPYSKDRLKIKSLLLETANNTKDIAIDKHQPFILLSDFGNFATVFEL